MARHTKWVIGGVALFGCALLAGLTCVHVGWTLDLLHSTVEPGGDDTSGGMLEWSETGLMKLNGQEVVLYAAMENGEIKSVHLVEVSDE